MHENKTAEFIKLLRKEKKWNQDTLAEKMHCDRTKISRIEKGTRKASLDDLVLISFIFDISIEELISGERKNKNNAQKIETTFKDYLKNELTKMNKIKIILIIAVLVLFLCTSIFAFIYFLQNYNSIKVYTISGHSENYTVENGILILSKDKIYFDLGNITPQIEEISIYREQDSKKEFIFKGDPNNILHDTYGYDAIISYEDFIASKQKIYIMIGEEKIDLTFIEDFKNDHLFYKKVKAIENIPEDITPEYVPPKILELFDCEDGNYSLVTDEEEMMIYSYGTFMVDIKNNSYTYFIDTKNFSYTDKDNHNDDFRINVDNEKNIFCLDGNCEQAEKIYGNFYKNYIQKYLE